MKFFLTFSDDSEYNNPYPQNQEFNPVEPVDPKDYGIVMPGGVQDVPADHLPTEHLPQDPAWQDPNHWQQQQPEVPMDMEEQDHAQAEIVQPHVDELPPETDTVVEETVKHYLESSKDFVRVFNLFFKRNCAMWYF